MRAFVLLWLLVACTPTPPASRAERLAAIRAAALSFGRALEAGELAAARPYATADAHRWLNAEAALRELEFAEATERAAPVAVRSATIAPDGHGVATMAIGEEGAAYELTLHLEIVGPRFLVFGMAPDESAQPTRFADRAADSLARLAAAHAAAVPHERLGPIAAAYLEAASRRDLVGMTKHMTPACIRSESDDNKRFTTGFARGAYALDRWRFAGHDLDGRRGRQRVLALLRLPDGSFDREPIEFVCRRDDDDWRIAEIR